MKLTFNLYRRLFKRDPVVFPRTHLSRQDDLYTRTRRVIEALGLEVDARDHRELQKRVEGILERYMRLDNCPNVTNNGAW